MNSSWTFAVRRSTTATCITCAIATAPLSTLKPLGALQLPSGVHNLTVRWMIVVYLKLLIGCKTTRLIINQLAIKHSLLGFPQLARFDTRRTRKVCRIGESSSKALVFGVCMTVFNTYLLLMCFFFPTGKATAGSAGYLSLPFWLP